MKAIFLHFHLGLGDSLVFNGLVRHLANFWPALVVPCKRHNLASVRWMFSDLDHVWVRPVSGDEEARQISMQSGWSMRLGLHGSEPLDFSAWDRQIYEQAGVPFNQRWHGFHLPGGVRTPDAKEMFQDAIFLHDDKERGFKIDSFAIDSNSPVIIAPRHIKNGTIFDWLADLQTASEIHVIDSAFLCLADSVPTLAQRLVFHKYARPSGHPPTLRKTWEII